MAAMTPTVEQRIARLRGWSDVALAAHVELEVRPLERVARAAITRDGAEAEVRLGLRNRKRRARTVRLGIGVTAAVEWPGGDMCRVPAMTLLNACDDEVAAVAAILAERERAATGQEGA